MVDEIAATWAEYQDYQDVRVLEIGMDLSPLLKGWKSEFEDERLKQLVRLTIDFTMQQRYSVPFVTKPHSFYDTALI